MDVLFRRNNGILPPVKIFEGRIAFLFCHGSQNIFNPAATILKRLHVIIGFRDGHHIHEPCNVPGPQNLKIVFNTNTEMWVELTQIDFHGLGSNRILKLVKARDRVAAEHSLESEIPQIVNAHRSACRCAKIAAGRIEADRERRIMDGEITVSQAVATIKRMYTLIYLEKYEQYLHG